jgi:hypothetical protein
MLLEQRSAFCEKQIDESLARIRKTTRAYVVFMPMAADDFVLSQDGIMEAGGKEPPKVPATERALQAAAKTREQSGVVLDPLAEVVTRQSQASRDDSLR